MFRSLSGVHPPGLFHCFIFTRTLALLQPSHHRNSSTCYIGRLGTYFTGHFLRQTRSIVVSLCCSGEEKGLAESCSEALAGNEAVYHWRQTKIPEVVRCAYLTDPIAQVGSPASTGKYGKAGGYFLFFMVNTEHPSPCIPNPRGKFLLCFHHIPAVPFRD